MTLSTPGSPPEAYGIQPLPVPLAFRYLLEELPAAADKNAMHQRTNLLGRLSLAVGLLGCLCSLSAADANERYLGRWALTIPGGGAGWLQVTKENGYYDASILWGGGSVVPVSSVFFENDALYVTRVSEVKRKDASGKTVRTHQFTELITGTVDGDQISLVTMRGRENGQGVERAEFGGKRIPELPPAPDLSKVKFGAPVVLFDGKNLSGWKLTDSHQVSGWAIVDGVLQNRPDQEEGKPHKSYGNLRTEKEFEDFNLTLETRLLKNGNSGIYLRGIYEVQVADTFGRSLDSHNMGGVYSRITPTESAEKPAGEWQTYDITLVNRHVTVILNGKKIIDNKPLLGCTGGALWSDEFRPGPIYLQGDHSSVDYRNIVIRPVVK